MPQSNEPMKRRTRSDRSNRSDKRANAALPSAIPAAIPKVWMTADWRQRRALMLRRLGDWIAYSRLRIGNMSFHRLQVAARADGEDLSESLLNRLELMRELPDDANVARKKVSFTAIAWLAAYSGQSLADLDRYLRGEHGERDERGVTISAPGEVAAESEADTLRTLYLALSPEHRQSVMLFAEHLYGVHLTEELGADKARGLLYGHAQAAALSAALSAAQAALATQATSVSDDTLATFGEHDEREYHEALDEARQARQEARTPRRRHARLQRIHQEQQQQQQQQQHPGEVGDTNDTGDTGTTGQTRST